VQVPPGRQRLAFHYAGLSLSVPERVRFKYRLDGFDRDWSQPVSARDTVYTNLGPGSYRFRVLASNSDGVWSRSEATLGFAIAPRLWQTTWFQLGIVVAIVVGAAGLYRLRMHQVARRLSLRFEERLAERTRIAQDLHDTLLQGFVSASMQLHVATSRVPAESPARPSLERVQQLMGRVIEEGRNAVRGLRSPHAGGDDLEQAFGRVQHELGSDGAAFRVIVEGRPQPLHPIIRDEVYRIGREALMNAARHSGAQKIEVEIDYAPAHVRILVRDDGCGIDEQVLRSGRDGHWGLSGMRERAERIGARFRVWSRAAAGTEIELFVPGPVAFQPARSARRPSTDERPT
jgi:signal transduction histidine kinase